MLYLSGYKSARASNLLMLIMLFCLAITSCKKSNKDNATQQLNYKIIAPKQITIVQYTDTTVSIPIGVHSISGNKNPATIYHTSLPDWVKTQDTSTTVMPDGLAMLTFRMHPYNSGQFYFNFFTHSLGTDTQRYEYNVSVNTANDCAEYLVGRYTNGLIPPRIITIKRTNNQNQVLINGCFANINCKEKKIDVPLYATKHGEYYGSGYYYNDSLHINIIEISYDYNNDTLSGVFTRL